MRTAALPFFIKRSEDEYSAMSVTTTSEVAHGLLRLDGERLVIQWRLARKTEHVGMQIRTDQEVESVQEVVVPLDAVAGATVRSGLLAWLTGGPRIVLTAADLRAFDVLAGEEGLRLDHPAKISLRLKRADRLAAEEFAAELALAVAEAALGEGRAEARLEEGRGGRAVKQPTQEE
jgi:hypothetical protein